MGVIHKMFRRFIRDNERFLEKTIINKSVYCCLPGSRAKLGKTMLVVYGTYIYECFLQTLH